MSLPLRHCLIEEHSIDKGLKSLLIVFGKSLGLYFGLVKNAIASSSDLILILDFPITCGIAKQTSDFLQSAMSGYYIKTNAGAIFSAASWSKPFPITILASFNIPKC